MVRGGPRRARSPPPAAGDRLRADRARRPRRGRRAQSGYWRDDDALFGRALELDGRNYVAHHHLGLAAAARGDLAAAARRHREALRLKPDYADAAIRLAGIRAHEGALDEAVDLYRAALRVEPRAAEARNSLGAALAGSGDLDGAIAAFREVLRADPGHADARFNLERALRLQGDPDGAAGRRDPPAGRAPAGAGDEPGR